MVQKNDRFSEPSKLILETPFESSISVVIPDFDEIISDEFIELFLEWLSRR